jgi:hypothetical protein
MKKIFLSILFVLSVIFSTQAAGIGVAYNNKDVNASADTETKAQFNNATQLATLRMNLENSIAKTSKLSITKRLALKSALNKVKKAEKTNGDVNSLLMTIGIILMIVGLVIFLLGLVLTSGFGKAGGTGGGGSLFVLGLILWLVGKFVDL